MSFTSGGVLDQLGIESKKTLLNLSLSASDLIGKVDLSDSVTKENAVTVEFINGKFITKLRISNNVLIYKEDLKNIPLLLNIIDQGDIKGGSIPLSYFNNDTQSQIALVFMHYYGYVTLINGEEYFNPNITLLFNSEWWLKIFDLARLNTLNYIEMEVKSGNQPVKNKAIIEESGLISIKEFKSVQPSIGMDILWALSIYFFDKIIRNWEEQELPENIFTDTIMDIDIAPGKYIKSLDAKNFFITQLRIFLGLRPNKLWFGGGYQSKFYEMIQKKENVLNKTIILEEMRFFTDYLNLIYSGGNNILNDSGESGTEPFAVKDLVYSEVQDGIHLNVVISLVIQINLYNDSNVYTLPVTTKIN